MDAFFESMADAVSAVVLIATDVEENDKLANNLVPAAKEVYRCAEALVSIGREVSQQWEKALDDKAMRQRTDEACGKTDQGCKDILNACIAMANAPKNTQQKRVLLDGCKTALTNATLLLQLADLYESVKLIRYAEAVLNVTNIFVNQVRVLSDFNTVAQDVMLGSVETAKLTQSRINFLSHPEYKRRLIDANSILKQRTEGYVFAVREAVLDESGGKGLRRNEEHGVVKGALEEIILVCKLSSRDLMDRLNLNFDPLLSGKLGNAPTEEDGLLDPSGINDAARRLNDLLKKLLDAIKRGDQPAVAAALKAIAAETGKPVDEALNAAVRMALANPTKEALRGVENAFRDYQGKLKPPEDDGAWKNRKGLEDDLLKALERLKKALGDLGDATNKKKQPEAIAAAKELAKEVQDLTDKADKYLAIYPRDADAAKEIERLKNDVKAHSAGLMGAVKAALNNPNDDALKALQDAMDRLRRAANALANSLIPTPTEEMKNIEEVVKPMLASLPPLAEAGERARAGERAEDIAKQLQRAMEIAANKYPGGRVQGVEGGPKSDPFRSKELDEALRRLRNAANALKDATGRAANAPQDATAQRHLGNETANTGDALNRLVKGFELNPQETLVDNAGGFDAALDKIAPAAKQGDVLNTNKQADRLNALWDDTMPVVKHLMQDSRDPALQNKVERLEQDMNNTLPALIKQAKKTAEAPAANRPAESKALDDLVKKARDINHDLVESIIDPEGKYLAERDRMKREMEKLADALRRGDKAAAEAAMDAIKDSAAKQRIYAKALALKATDPKIKKKLLDAALEMQDAVIGVLDAARAALNGTNSVDAAERAMAPFIQRYDDASNAIASTFGAPPAPPAGSREGLDGAAAEMQDLVRNLVVDKTAEGQLFGVAKDLAEAMAKLSAAAKSGNKKEIIMCARRIAELVAEVLKQAQEAAARCTDKRLSETLLTHAQAAKNFATQLKILTAVKAATYDDDPTVKQQLVKCAKQLAGAMTKTVNAAEISKLRAKK